MVFSGGGGGGKEDVQQCGSHVLWEPKSLRMLLIGTAQAFQLQKQHVVGGRFNKNHPSFSC